MKYIIIDDEVLGVEVLKKLLEDNYPNAEFAGSAFSMDGGIALIAESKPDVVFLDIELRGGSGFDLLNKLEKIDFKVVFVTSYDQYAIKAIKFNVFDYLLKPVMVDELLACLSRMEIERVNTHIHVNPEPNKLYINHKTKLEYVNFTDIIYLQGDGNYTNIHTCQGRENYTSKTLKEYDGLLCLPGSSFIRIHKSYIVNVYFVESVIKHDNVYLVLKNGEKLEVSRRKRSLVFDRIKISQV
jgi:two-component system LytT family response regulator